VNSDRQIFRPLLAQHARYRWDGIRRQHQIVFPEGVLVLNESAAAVARLCDGRSRDELIAALEQQFSEGNPAADLDEFLQRLGRKGLLRDAADP
jgi:pyrroloquinoline quinone biosynthesis protein D